MSVGKNCCNWQVRVANCSHIKLYQRVLFYRELCTNLHKQKLVCHTAYITIRED